MKFAVPVADEKLALHFGHAKKFAFISVDPQTKKIIGKEEVDAPPHEHGKLPGWLSAQGVTNAIAGGIGEQAIKFFEAAGVSVVFGAPALAPEILVMRVLSGELKNGENACDHDER